MRAGGLSATSNHGRYPGAADPSLGAPEPPLVVALSAMTLVDRDPDWTFRELHDLEALLACVPGGSLSRLIDNRRFEARIVVGVGPFKIAYAGAGRIVASNPRLRTASIVLTGRSPANLPPVRIRMSMAVREHRRGSEVSMAFQLGVMDSGRLLGAGLIDSIAREMVDRTVDRIKRQLEAPPHLDPVA
jgi:carbon monoxide dehydrogenase subunit G